MFDEAKEVDVAVSKKRNKFRGPKNKRLSAKEMMRASHLRGKKAMKADKEDKKLLLALHSLFQTCYIFFTYRMVDGSSILENVK